MKWTMRIIAALIVSTCMNGLVFAQQYSSNGYQINEYFIGPGGDTDLSSSQYSARATLGDLATGNLQGTDYQLYGGFTTTDVPYIELYIPNTLIDMGVLDTTRTGYGTATFSVRTYLAENYVVHAAGGLPTNESGNTIDAIGTPSAVSRGTEQFGLNLWTNNVELEDGQGTTAFGALPVQVPDSTFSFGTVDNDYNDDGLFAYNTADTVAGYAGSSGQTDYTASYVMNVAATTEAGLYQTSQTFVATSTY